MLQNSGLLERLTAIESTLRGTTDPTALAQTGVESEVPTQLISSAPVTIVNEPLQNTSAPQSSYVDLFDSKLQRSGSGPIPVDASTLDARNFVVYRFGVFVADLLARSKFDRVNILLASMLPAPQPQLQNSYAFNAFKNSMYFDAPSCTLFIRIERMQSLGDFVLVIMHAVAHVTAHSMESDAEPAFLREFHRALRVCCEDLFFARMSYRSANEPAAAVSSALQQAGTQFAKENAIDDLIAQRTDASLNIENIKLKVRSLVGESETKILGGKLDLIDETAQVTINVTGRLNVLTSELKQMHAQSSSLALNEHQHSTPAPVPPTNHAAAQVDAAESELKEATVELERSQKDCATVKRNIAELKDKLLGATGSVPESDLRWSELSDLEARQTVGLISVDQLQKRVAAVTLRLSALKQVAGK